MDLVFFVAALIMMLAGIVGALLGLCVKLPALLEGKGPIWSPPGTAGYLAAELDKCMLEGRNNGPRAAALRKRLHDVTL